MHDVLDADNTSLYRSAAARMHYLAVNSPNIQYAVRMCSKSMSRPRVKDRQKLKRVARYVMGCPDTRIMVAWQQHPADSLCRSTVIGAGDKSTRNGVSAGNICYGQNLLCSWSKYQTVLAMSSGQAELCAASMAAQQAMGTKSMARELGVHLDAMELQVDAILAIGIIGRQGLRILRHVDLSYLWQQPLV